MVCRLGGDEFVVLAVGATRTEATEVVERIDHELASGAAVGLVHFSWGAAERSPRSDLTLAALQDAADQDMYQQKVLSRLRRGESA